MSPARDERSHLLRAELRWLMRLRWLAAAMIAALAAAPWSWTGVRVAPWTLVALGASVAACNAILWLLRDRLCGPRTAWSDLRIFGTAQIYLDLTFLFALVHLTGDLRSPVVGLFIFHMVFASLLQSRTRAYLTAVVAVLLVGASLRLTNEGAPERRDALNAVSWACTLAVTVYLTDRVTQKLFRRERARVRQARRLRAMAERVRTQQAVLVQQEKLAAMGHMAAGISHEITSPLANMDGLLQLMQRKDEPLRREDLGVLREQVARIHRTVRQLTAFAHPGEGQVEVLPVNEVVASALALLRFDRRLSRVRVERALAEDAGSARVSAHGLEQVLTNIVRNSLDAMEGAPEPRLTVRTSRHNGSCAIEISDNGCGIPPEGLKQIFEPFYTTKPVGQGTGLGLSISAKIIRDHNGSIDVASEPGRGTTFTIRLPAVEAVHARGTVVPVRMPAGENGMLKSTGLEAGMRRKP